MEEKKKFILVTGASSGIGRHIAIGLSMSHNVILNGRNQERLVEAKGMCSKANSQLIFNFDLSGVEKLEAELSDFIQNSNIEITQFVHCAGFMKMVPLKMITLETLTSTYSTNTISAVLILKALTNRKVNNAALRSAVFISSNVSNFGAKAFSAYASSKAALDSMMRCLAVELAPKVRINSVLPGAIHTEMTSTIFENSETLERMLSSYPLGEGKPEDICSMVEFLLSEKSRWITGQQFSVDGGRTINISG